MEKKCRGSVFVFGIAWLALLTSCGGSGGGGGGGQGFGGDPSPSRLDGTAHKGTVRGATVEAYVLLSTGVRGDLLAETTTTADGSFSLDLGGYKGPVWVQASGGKYIDEATAELRTLPHDCPLLGVTVHRGGVTVLHLTFASHLASRRAAVLAAKAEVDSALAVETATAVVDLYCGTRGGLRTKPVDLTVGPVKDHPGVELGAISAGFMLLATGFVDDPLEVLDAIGVDGADGTFDGTHFGAELWLPSGKRLPAETGGRLLAEAIERFLDDHPRNVSGIGSVDVACVGAITARVDGDISTYHSPPRIVGLSATAGELSGGGHVELRGSGLAGARVWLGARECTVVTSSDTRLELIAPQANIAGAVDLEIRSSETGLVCRVAGVFKYYEGGAPVLASICPTTGPEAGGSLLELRGVRLGPAATVEVGGVAARVVARFPPARLIAVAPAGSGTVDVRVIDGDESTTLSAAFRYGDQGAGSLEVDTSVTGSWAIYGIQHSHAGASSFAGLAESLVLNVDGTVEADGIRRETSPHDLFGTESESRTSGTYLVRADDSVVFDLDSTTEASARIGSARLHADGNVFVSREAGESVTTGMRIGIRTSQKGHVPAISGRFSLMVFGHAYLDASGARKRTILRSKVELDGAGGGSFSGDLSALTTLDASVRTRAESGLLRYAVSEGGDLSLTLRGETHFFGSVSPDGHLAAGVCLGEDGTIALLLLLKEDAGVMVGEAVGSWYGVSCSQSQSGSPALHVASDSELRLIFDHRGHVLQESQTRATWDGKSEVEIAHRLHALTRFESPCGGLWSSSKGARPVGFFHSAHGFAVLAADSPDALGLDFGLLFRGASRYSHHTVAGTFNSLWVKSKFESSDPPTGEERLEACVGSAVVDVESSASFGLESFAAGGTLSVRQTLAKSSERLADGSVVTDLSVKEKVTVYGCAVSGDGHILVFHEPKGLTIESELSLDGFVGDVVASGDLVVVRRLPGAGSASELALLGRKTHAELSLDGDFHGGCLSAGFTGGVEILSEAEATRGFVSFNAPLEGLFTASADVIIDREGGITTHDFRSTVGTFAIDSEGRVAVESPGRSKLGFVTADGEAIFLVDVTDTNTTTGLSMLVKAGADPSPVDGEYLTTTLTRKLDKKGISGEITSGISTAVTTIHDGVVEGATRLCVDWKNTSEVPEVSFEAGANGDLVIDSVGAIKVIATHETHTGALSPSGHYGFLVPGDGHPVDVKLQLLFCE